MSITDKISAGWNVMKLGQQVSDPDLWTKRKDFGNKIGGLILALVVLGKAFGYDLSGYIDEDFALLLGGVISTVWNLVLTRAATKSLGLPAKPGPDPAPQPGNDPYADAERPRNDRNLGDLN